MLISRNFIPSLFTILNGVCGFLAVINATNGNFDLACMFIFYAMLFDAFDGIIARALNSSSQFGVELDSLSDVISFGFAPSYLLYSLHFNNIETFGIIVSVLFLVFAAIRLARFNVQLVGFNKDMFNGLPAPFAAATLCSYILFYHNKIFSEELSNITLWVLAIALPLLMVSKFGYDTLPKFSKRGIKENPAKFIVFLIAVVLVLVTRGEAAFSFCLLFILTGIVRSLMNKIKKKTNNFEQEEDEFLEIEESNSK